ncbi:MAG: ATP-binding protein [Planctomycetota bacterium]|jgi:Fe-S-cluster-containing hydrogenase component 2
MKKSRPIIRIDEDLCTGCGECILACAEGALKLVDGKAKLVGDILCDGLGACLGECPEGALEVIEREADEFDEAAVEERLKVLGRDPAPQAPSPATFAACPGSASMALKKAVAECEEPTEEIASTLGHWPVKLQLLGPQAPFLKGSDLLLVADCVGIAYTGVHKNLIAGKTVAIGCPKLDDLQAHIDRRLLGSEDPPQTCHDLTHGRDHLGRARTHGSSRGHGLIVRGFLFGSFSGPKFEG